MAVTFRDFAAAKEHLSKSRNKFSRPVSGNTTVEWINEHWIGLRYHDTIVVAWSVDGSFLVNTGGWFTQTTFGRINTYSKARVGMLDGSPVVWHPMTNTKTPPKLSKCRTCRGRGTWEEECAGTAYRYRDGEYGPGPCWHDQTSPHPVPATCHRCKATGTADYGSKTVPYQWAGDWLRCSADGRPIGPDGFPERTIFKPFAKSAPAVHCHAHTYTPPTTVDEPISSTAITGGLAAIIPDFNTTVLAPCDCEYTNSLYQGVIHLNDTHHWTRAAIADWLDTLDLDLRVTQPA